MKQIELLEYFKHGIPDCQKEFESGLAGCPPDRDGQTDKKNGLATVSGVGRACTTPIRNREYHELYKRAFKHNVSRVEIKQTSHDKVNTWAKIERRMFSNEAAVRVGLHRASMWTRGQLMNWAKFKARRKASRRWDSAFQLRIRPEESVLLLSGWELTTKGVV